MNGDNTVRLVKNVTGVEKTIVAELVFLGIIDERFTGSVTLHFTQGSISEVDRLEKNLRKKLICDNKV